MGDRKMEEETIVECEDYCETIDLAERVVNNILGIDEADE